MRTSCEKNLLLFAVLCLLLPGQVQAQSQVSNTIESVLPKTVKIFGAGGLANLASYGTGFIVSPQGQIVTVWSHVLDTDRLRVVLNDGRRFTAEIQDFDPELDIALLQLSGEHTDLPYFDVSRGLNASLGTRVLAFSNMYKVATGNEPVSVMRAVIAAKTRLDARRGTFKVPFKGPVYIVDAATNNSGAAGGVLTDYRGRLVGIIGKELRNNKTNTWVNYSVPITNVSDAIMAMQKGEYSGQREITSASDSSDEVNTTLEELGLVMIPDVVSRTPAFVDKVLSESPAAEIGVKPGDVVLFVNDQIIHSVSALKDAVAPLQEFDTVKLLIRRDEEIITHEIMVP